jgi:hypothetical protein
VQSSIDGSHASLLTLLVLSVAIEGGDVVYVTIGGSSEVLVLFNWSRHSSGVRVFTLMLH